MVLSRYSMRYTSAITALERVKIIVTRVIYMLYGCSKFYIFLTYSGGIVVGLFKSELFPYAQSRVCVG